MDWEQHLAEMADHLIRMSRQPESLEHARHRVREMTSQHPDLYGTLPQIIKERMNEQDRRDA